MRAKITTVSSIMALLSVGCLTGCGDDDPSNPPDARPPDAGEVDAGGPDANTPPAFDPTKKTVELSTGISMKYVEAGKADGKVVILLHGYTDSSRSFFPTIEALVQEDPELHIFALDARGHGDSSMPAEANCRNTPEQCFEAEDFAADVIAFMDDQGIDKAHIVGHSMGSMIAEELALSSPARVESLVLIGAFVNGVGNPVLNDFLLTGTIEGLWKPALEANADFGNWPQDAYELTPKDADPNAEQWMAQNWVADPVADQAFIQSIVPETTAIRLGTWLGAAIELNVTDNRERMKGLTVPTLVIWATQDNVFPEADQAALRASLDVAVEECKTRYFFKTYGKLALPESGLQESDLGHNTQWGAPGPVAKDIAAFISTGEPTTDLPYADPADVSTLKVDVGAATIIEKQPVENCTPPAN